MPIAAKVPAATTPKPASSSSGAGHKAAPVKGHGSATKGTSKPHAKPHAKPHVKPHAKPHRKPHPKPVSKASKAKAHPKAAPSKTKGHSSHVQG